MDETKDTVTEDQLIALATALADKMQLTGSFQDSLAYSSCVHGETVMLAAEPTITQSEGLVSFKVSLIVLNRRNSITVYRPDIKVRGYVQTLETDALFTALEKRYVALDNLKKEKVKKLMYEAYQLLLEESQMSTD